MNKALVVGASGFIGGAITRCLRERGWWVTGTYSNSKRSDVQLVLPDDEKLKSLNDNLDPDVIIWAPNFPGGVDACEQARHESYRFHVKAIRELAKIFHNDYSTYLVYLSTDYVFNGLFEGRTEEHYCDPIQAYGSHKFMAEEILRNEWSEKKLLIVRLSSVFGWDPNSLNFARTVYRHCVGDIDVPHFSSIQMCTPTLVDDIPSAIISLLKNDWCGTFHIAGASYMSRYDLAVKLAEAMGFQTSQIPPTTATQATLEHNIRPIKGGLLSTKNPWPFGQPTFESMIERFKKAFHETQNGSAN